MIELFIDCIIGLCIIAFLNSVSPAKIPFKDSFLDKKNIIFVVVFMILEMIFHFGFIISLIVAFALSYFIQNNLFK